MNFTESLIDQMQIRQRIDEWVLFRDAGAWDRFATVWHPDGHMATTWCDVNAMEFITLSRRGWDAGAKVHHSQGGTVIDIRGARAIAQTKMQILQRGPVHGVMVDVACQGRFWDAFEKRDGRWALYLRQPIYETDHMYAVDPAARLELEPELLSSFPEGYRHLAYLQKSLGMDVRANLPGTRGAEIEALHVRGERWLAGDNASCLAA